MFNTFRSLVTKQVLLYLVKNAPNLIFIRLGERSLLAIWISANKSKFGLYKHTRFSLQASLFLIKDSIKHSFQ